MSARTFGHVLLVLAVVAGTTLPAAGAAGWRPAGDAPATAAPGTTAANNSTVNVSVGHQLSTVIGASGDDVRVEVENEAFEAAFEDGNDSERAEAVARRAVALRERARTIRADYREATRAFEAGDLPRSAYAQRLAALNARARNLLAAVDRLRRHAGELSALELRAAGVNRSTLAAAVRQVRNVSGPGASALFRRFVGDADGEVEVETAGGLAIEVERDDGERSREFERARDANRSLSANQSAALSAARRALSAPANGTWTLVRASVHDVGRDAYYRFEFALRLAGATGEAEVRVDGSSGEVFRLEEEVEREEDEDDEERDDRGRDDERGDDDERDEDDGTDDLALVVARGTPAPDATVVVQALAGGEPAANVAVTLDGRLVGTTGANGTVTVDLPTGEAELRAERGEAELEFEFDDDDALRSLRTDATLRNGTVTVRVAFDGSPVADALVFVEGRRVGTTDAEGVVAFDVPSDEEFDLEVVKGEFEAETEFVVRDGAVRQTETASDSDDGDEDESEDEDDGSGSDSG